MKRARAGKLHIQNAWGRRDYKVQKRNWCQEEGEEEGEEEGGLLTHSFDAGECLTTSSTESTM